MKKVDPKVLLDNNVIDNETYEKIISFTSKKNKEENQNKKINLLMNIIAAVFAILGIGWIVAANWAIIPGIFKVVIGFLLVCISLVYLINQKSKGANLEIASILYSALSIFEIALIGQYFNTSPNIEMFWIIAMLIIGVVSFYSYSWICSILYLIISSILTITTANIFELFSLTENSFLTKFEWLGILITYLLYLVIPALTIKFAKIKFDKDEGIKQKYVYKSLLLVMIAIMLFTYACIVSPVYGVIVTLVYAMYILTKLSNRNIQMKVYRFLIYFSLILGSIFGCDFLFDDNFNFNIVIYLIIALGIFIYYLKNYLSAKKEYQNMLYKNTDFDDSSINHDKHAESIKTLGYKKVVLKNDALVMCTVIIWPVFNIIDAIISSNKNITFNLNDITKYLFIIYVLYLGIHFMGSAIKENIISKFYIGEILFTFEIFRLLFEVSDNLMIKGIFAILVAICVIIFNNKNLKKINKKG